MSFTLFNALQIFKLTVKLMIQPASVAAEMAFSVCGLFATNPSLVTRLHNRCVVLHKKRFAKAVNVENAWFSFRHICSADFNPI